MPPYDDEMFDDAEFDKQFTRMQRTARTGFKLVGAAAVAMIAFALGVTVFVGWVIVQILQHFNIIG